MSVAFSAAPPSNLASIDAADTINRFLAPDFVVSTSESCLVAVQSASFEEYDASRRCVAAACPAGMHLPAFCTPVCEAPSSCTLSVLAPLTWRHTPHARSLRCSVRMGCFSVGTWSSTRVYRAGELRSPPPPTVHVKREGRGGLFACLALVRRRRRMDPPGRRPGPGACGHTCHWPADVRLRDAVCRAFPKMSGTRLAYSRDGGFIVAGLQDGYLHIVDTESLQDIYTTRNTPAHVCRLATATTGDSVAISDSRQHVLLYSLLPYKNGQRWEYIGKSQVHHAEVVGLQVRLRRPWLDNWLTHASAGVRHGERLWLVGWLTHTCAGGRVHARWEHFGFGESPSGQTRLFSLGADGRVAEYDLERSSPSAGLVLGRHTDLPPPTVPSALAFAPPLPYFAAYATDTLLLLCGEIWPQGGLVCKAWLGCSRCAVRFGNGELSFAAHGWAAPAVRARWGSMHATCSMWKRRAVHVLAACQQAVHCWGLVSKRCIARGLSASGARAGGLSESGALLGACQQACLPAQ
eukprot:365274-Chlamydomonas_euryale.AAC.8